MIHKTVLPNGIPVFVVESHASPVVSIHAVVTRGSIHEPDKLAGISHYLEHSLFKGTKKRQVGRIALEIESHGGEINAFTSFAETAYYTTIASRYFEEGLDVIADAIQNPTFDSDEMEKEKEVILEEIKRANDSPHKVLSHNMWKLAFAGTPYGRPVLGFESTVRKINSRTLSDYFRKHYHAGTISLFIVGDVDRAKAISSAAKKLTKIPKRPVPATPPFKIPRTSTPKFIAVAKEIEETHIQIGIPVPGIHDAATPELDLMCSALGQGESSRLYQRLVKEKQLALETHIGMMATGHCGIVMLHLTVAPEKATVAVEETYRLLTEVARTGLEVDEIDRIKSSLESDTIFAKETVDGYARRLGYYYCEFNNPEFESTYLNELMSVTPSEATEAISKVFAKPGIISAVHPKAAPLDKDAILKIVKTGFTPHKHTTVVETPLNRETRGGITFVSKKTLTLPTLSLRLIFKGGSRLETVKQLGLGTLFSRVWSSGTDRYTSLKIAKILESLGASVHTYCGRNTLGLSVECLTKHWSSLRPIVHDVLARPTFPGDEFDTEKNLLLREILAEKDSPGAVVHLGLMERLFPNHPYGRSALGTKGSVEGLKREDLIDFYKRNVHQKHLVVAMVGDFKGDLIADVTELCATLPVSGNMDNIKLTAKPATEVSAVVARKTPLHQSHIMVGFMAASLYDPDRYALKILSSALSGQGGRLFLELRDKQSLAYSVSPMQSDGPDAGTFSFYIGCSPEKWRKSLSGIRHEIQKVIDTPMGATELARAKQYWLGRFDLDMQRASSQCFTFGLDEVYGLGYDHSTKVVELVRAIDAKTIQRVAARYLDPNLATISIVHGDALSEAEVIESWQPGIKTRQTKERIMEAV
ncbi:MAG: insulinase family protein [Deltaproteobacteria bacterium]|nr:insulinase family protein [Deltaproteobacteria bacterium]